MLCLSGSAHLLRLRHRRRMVWRKAFEAAGLVVMLALSVAPQVQAVVMDGASPAAVVTNDTQTKYPIVLVHGMLGFSKMGGIDYFYGIPADLRSGGAQVFVASVSSLNTSEVRGEQLLSQVQKILASTGAQKVNLIGHSHGGPTIRYVAGVAPQLVASVTSVGGVNKGSKVADWVVRMLPSGSFRETVVVASAKALAQLIGKFSGRDAPEEPLAALAAVSTAGAAAFNLKFPQGVPAGCDNGPELVNGVRYYSWTGNRVFTHVLDISDYLLYPLSRLHDEPNDGLVSVCSSRLGTSIGVYGQTHLDEINQLLGLRDSQSISPVTLYREHARRLKNMGL